MQLATQYVYIIILRHSNYIREGIFPPIVFVRADRRIIDDQPGVYQDVINYLVSIPLKQVSEKEEKYVYLFAHKHCH